MTKAVRTRSWLAIALYGPSGSGKTWSAFELATGANRVSGGKVAIIDTENGRALRYAEHFDFFHVPLDPPFESEAYLDAIQYAVAQGASQVIVDSMSHEHEGEGGVLQRHDAIAEEMARKWGIPKEKASFSAWGPAKSGRQQLLQFLLRNPGVDLFMCFRAKVKSKPGVDARGKQGIVNMGWQPIGGEELVFEMSAQCALTSGKQGLPEWDDEHMKLPEEFKAILTKGKLTADMGEAMARWSLGNDKAKAAQAPSPLFLELLREVNEAGEPSILADAGKRIASNENKLTKVELGSLRRAYKTADTKLAGSVIT